MKWYNKLFIALLIIISSPLIVFFLICVAIAMPIEAIKNRKDYKKSHYYRDLNIPYKKDILSSAPFRFYNTMRDSTSPESKNIKYTRLKSDGGDCFIYNGAVYLFPDFNELRYFKEEGKWKIVYIKYEEESFGDIEDYINIRKYCICSDCNSDDNFLHLPIKIILERRCISDLTLEEKPLPDCIWLVKEYELAFERLDFSILSVIPQTMKELYSQLINTPDLCGRFELVDDETINWTYKGLFMTIGDKYIGVDVKNKRGKFKSRLIHWHPEPEEIYGDVFRITKKGSVLVIKKNFANEYILYMGAKNTCPYSKPEKRLFNKLYYFEIE